MLFVPTPEALGYDPASPMMGRYRVQCLGLPPPTRLPLPSDAHPSPAPPSSSGTLTWALLASSWGAAGVHMGDAAQIKA